MLKVGIRMWGRLYLGEILPWELTVRPAEQNWWDGSDKKDQYEDDWRKERPSSFSINSLNQDGGKLHRIMDSNGGRPLLLKEKLCALSE